MNAASQDVSVVIPAFNAARYLEAALDSVAQQTHRPHQVIVVDDGSDDHTADLARGYPRIPVEILSIAHRGPSAARNCGVAAARCAWLAFLDADDLWSPDKLARQFAAMEREPLVHGAFGHVQQFISQELTAEQRQSLHCPSQPAAGLTAGTLLIEREAFLAVGGFDENLPAGEFFAWYGAASRCGLHFAMTDAVVLHRRIHLHNSTRTNPTTRNAGYLSAVRAHLREQARMPKP